MIAVTGANGLLGSFVIRKLIEENAPFLAFKRASSDTSHLQQLDGKIDWRVVDILDEDELSEHLTGVDGVIHAAGMVSFDPRKRSKLLNANLRGTSNIVNACLELKIPRLLYVSSIAALPSPLEATVVNEEMRHSIGKNLYPYGDSKYKAELEVFRGQEEGLHTVIVNPSVILSPENWSRSSGRIFSYLVRQFPFYVNGLMNYVDVRDVSDTIYALYNSDLENQRIILNAGSIEFGEFLTHAARCLGKKPPHIKVPLTVLRFAVYFEALRSLIAGDEPLFTKESTKLAESNTYYDNSKVRRILDFEFRPIESTLEWCCGRRSSTE